MLKFLFRAMFLLFISLIFIISYVFYNLNSAVILRPKSGAGIGNQLFQYAAAYSLARETNSKLIIITKHSQKKLTGDIENDNRHFALNKFNIKYDEIVARYSSIDGFLLNLLFSRKFSESVNYVLSYFGRKIEFVNERNFFRLAKPYKNTIYIIDDYFESEIFFKKYSGELKQFLKPIVTNPEKLTPYLAKLNKPKSFCVHVRRGDVSNSSGIYYLPIDYQNKAIELAKQIVSDSYFYIFTDSPDLVKEELNDKHNIEFVSSKDLTSLDDFALMSACANNIIARSTFSWWAAYLSLIPNKIVIGPNPRYSKEWIDSCSNDPIIREEKRELFKNNAYPDSWIKVQL